MWHCLRAWSFRQYLDYQANGTESIYLEKSNFKDDGEILAEIWSKWVINGYSVVAKYLNLDNPKTPILKSDKWITQHVPQSQY